MNPTLSQLHRELAAVLRRQGDLQAAANAYRQAIALTPDASTYHELGLTRFAQEQWEEAIACYRQAIELGGSGVGCRVSEVSGADAWLAMVYSNLGCALVQQGELAEAIACFERGIRLSPSWATLWVNLGQAKAQRDCEAAIACFDRAICLEPTAVAAHQQRADLLQRQECWSEAIASWQRVIDLSPDNVAAWGELAIAQMAQGNWHEAIASLQSALRHQPEFGRAFCDRASQLSADDAWARARIAVAQFLQCLPSESDSLPLLAVVYLNRAIVLWQYGGAAQMQQGDADFATARRIAKAATVPLSFSRPAIEPPTPPAGIYPTTAGWFAAAAPKGDYFALNAVQTVAIESSESACAGLNCAPCLQQLQRQFASVHLGRGAYVCGSADSIAPEPSLFVATIPQGRSWAVPQQNDWRICNAVAVLTPTDELLADLARDYPGQLPNCRQFQPQHRIFSTARPAIEPISGAVAALAGLSGHVYFHWMADVLPRLDLLRRAGCDWREIDRFWLNGNSQPFQQETLAALGIPAEKVLSSDRHPYIQAELLIAPSFASPLGWMSIDSLNFLRRMFLPIATETKWPPRLYISRCSARYRRVLNEDAAIDLLRPAGFVPVVLEALSFAEQVALFAQAEAIVAPHGSGLTNLAFCRPQTTVIELFAPEYVRPYYWAIAHHLRLRHYWAIGQSSACRPLQTWMHPNPLTADILVNLDALKHLLKTAEVI